MRLLVLTGSCGSPDEACAQGVWPTSFFRIRYPERGSQTLWQAVLQSPRRYWLFLRHPPTLLCLCTSNRSQDCSLCKKAGFAYAQGSLPLCVSGVKRDDSDAQACMMGVFERAYPIRSRVKVQKSGMHFLVSMIG